MMKVLVVVISLIVCLATSEARRRTDRFLTGKRFGIPEDPQSDSGEVYYGGPALQKREGATIGPDLPPPYGRRRAYISQETRESLKDSPKTRSKIPTDKPVPPQGKRAYRWM